MRILAIEDDADTREMYIRMLRDERHEAIVAATGADGLRLSAERPDLIILDLGLPDIDGYEVLRALKTDPGTADVPVLIVSASRFEPPADVPGFVAALRKPVDLPMLPAIVSLVGIGSGPSKG